MSVKIFAESEVSWEIRLFYQTVYKNFVVLIQQRLQDDVWNVYHHCLLPNILINAIASLPGCLLLVATYPQKKLPACRDCNINSLPDERKRTATAVNAYL